MPDGFDVFDADDPAGQFRLEMAKESRQACVGVTVGGRIALIFGDDEYHLDPDDALVFAEAILLSLKQVPEVLEKIRLEGKS